MKVDIVEFFLRRDKPDLRVNILWNTFGNVFYLGVQWLLTYIVILELGYEEAGVFSLAMTIATSFSAVSLYSVRNYQVSDVEGLFSPGAYIRARRVTCFIAFALCLGFVLANSYPAVTSFCVMSYMLFKIAESASDVYQGFLQLHSRLDIVGISYGIKGTLALAVFFFVILVTGDLLLAISSLAVVVFLVVVLLEKRAAGFFLEEDSCGFGSDAIGLLRVCFPLALFGFLFALVGQAPRYILEIELGAEMLGVYTSVAMPAVLVQAAASYLFNPLATPLASNLAAGDRAAFTKLFIRALSSVIFVSVLFLLLFALFGKCLLLLLFGSSGGSYSYLLMPLVLCAVLTALAWFLSTVVVVLRRLNLLCLFGGVSFLIVVFATAPAIGVWGANGASFALLAALAFFVVCCSALIVSASFRSQG